MTDVQFTAGVNFESDFFITETAVTQVEPTKSKHAYHIPSQLENMPCTFPVKTNVFQLELVASDKSKVVVFFWKKEIRNIFLVQTDIPVNTQVVLEECKLVPCDDENKQSNMLLFFLLDDLQRFGPRSKK